MRSTYRVKIAPRQRSLYAVWVSQQISKGLSAGLGQQREEVKAGYFATALRQGEGPHNLTGKGYSNRLIPIRLTWEGDVRRPSLQRLPH